MKSPVFSAALALPLFLVACAGSGHQKVPMPVANSTVAADRCRVFVLREGELQGSLRNVRVFDDDTEIGVVGDGEYLCWDRGAARGAGRFIFEGIGFDQKAVESYIDLPREPGSTTYFSIHIVRDSRKPEITPLTSDAGRALIAARKPATVE